MQVIIDYVVGYLGRDSTGSFEVDQDSIPRVGDRIAVKVENRAKQVTIKDVWPVAIFQGRAHVKIDCRPVGPDSPPL